MNPVSTPPPAPHASRRERPGWRDPRLAIGLALVALSVVIGARVVGAADDTVGVWAAARNIEAGEPVTADDLVRRQVRFADGDLADHYLSTGDEVPADAALAQPVGEGELLPRALLTSTDRVGLIEVPLSVASGSFPPRLRVGSSVDVWLVPTDASSGREVRAKLHLQDAVVLAVGKDSGEFSVSGERSLLVGVPESGSDQVARLLGALAGHRVVITRRS